MKSLSEKLFRQLAGDNAYQKGKTYYHEGRVRDLQIDQPKITAQVAGQQDYHVVLHHTPKLFEGECSCPASNYFDFCKHCVAVALHYYYQTQINQELADNIESSPLLGYLNTLTKPQLAHELHRLLLNDEIALDRWQLRADIASGRVNSSNLRKRITKAIPYKPSGLWRYRDVSAYFDNCDENLAILEAPLFALEPANAIKLVIYALQRFEKTLDTVDDSSGYRAVLEQRLQKWFNSLLSSELWESKSKTALIAELILDKKYRYEALSLLSGVASSLSNQECDEIITTVQHAWLKLSPDNAAYSDESFYYTRLEQVLLTQARQKKDRQAEFEILERGAVDVARCLDLVKRYIVNDQLTEANKWLDYAAKINQSNAHELYEIESAKIELWQSEGRYDDALQALWARFEEQEKASLLQQVISVATHLDQQDIWRNKGIALLAAKLDYQDHTQRNRQRAETLVTIYLDNQLMDEAIALANTNLLTPETLMNIIEANPLLNKSSFQVLEKAVNQYLDRIGQSVYDDTISFLLRQQEHIDQAQQTEFDDVLFSIYRNPKNLRKTNFIKRLKAEFPSAFDIES